MKTLKDVQAKIVTGAVIEVVENTFRPDLNGTRRVITKAQKQNYHFYQMSPDGSTVTGEACWGRLPERASDILESSGDTVKFKMRSAGVGHTMTIRFVGSHP